jgi:hypothetical protein
VGDHIIGGLQSGGGGSLLPLFGDRVAEFIAHAAVIGRDGVVSTKVSGASTGLRQRAGMTSSASLGRFHESETEAGGRVCLSSFGVIDTLRRFGELQPNRVTVPADQENGGAVDRVRPGLHPGIDDRLFAVDPEPQSVLGADHKLVQAGIRRDNASAPADRELMRLELGPFGKSRSQS